MSYGRTFHLFLPVCCPATLVIIPHTPAVVNHKITFFQKRMSFNSGTFFLFCVQHHVPPFHLVSHGCVHEQNTVAFYFTNYYNKEDALSNGKCTRADAASIYRKEKGIASKKELTQCIRSLKRSR